MGNVSTVTFCSSANLGPGFDVMALALDVFYDRILVSEGEKTHSPSITVAGNGVPSKAEENTAGLSLTRLIEDFGIERSINVKIEKGIPPGLGLGSSGASAVGAVLAADKLFNLGLTKEKIVEYSMYGEIASSGTPHPDNVAAAAFGNLAIVTSIDPLRVRSFRVAENLSFLLMMPDLRIENKTRRCRELVPSTVHMHDVVSNSRSLASLLPGLLSGDAELLSAGLEDRIVEEARKPLYQYYEELKKAMVSHGAIGACLSGAGPSVLVFLDAGTPINPLLKVAQSIFGKYGYKVTFALARPAGGAAIEQSDTY
ncbi:MAG: homoserine kinase [Thermoplasmataceae archaeon]